VRLIVHAVNIHQGGGRTLLTSIIEVLKESSCILIDTRLGDLPDIKSYLEIHSFDKSFFSRLQAEIKLKKLASNNDVILCLGNLPPLFKLRGKTYVFLQNKYLCTNQSLSGFNWKVRLRIWTERLWLRTFIKNVQIIVQTETMKQSVKSFLKRDALVLPFMPVHSVKNNTVLDKKYDFIYVASGEPHKNHQELINAWVILASEGIRPSLLLTLSLNNDCRLIKLIDDYKVKYDLNIENIHAPSDKISDLYHQSKALIYPSTFESFGLPLLEAAHYGLDILASEKDYVRDVVYPQITFEPDSALSIARAVKRYLNIRNEITNPVDPESFLKRLSSMHASLQQRHQSK